MADTLKSRQRIWQPRVVPEAACAALLAAGVNPVLARVLAARGVVAAQDLPYDLEHLLPFTALAHAERAAVLLADAIGDGRRMLIVGDYDADGATASALGVVGLRAMGATVDYLVPNRFEYGYGLTPEIVTLAAERRPDLLITVDNGIASVAGVAEAARRGIPVLVTDHHLPGDVLPAAACIVNPNQPGCSFPSKGLAGVGVMFYVMMALRAELRRRNGFADRPPPNLAELLDLVALGTVADVVRLDRNNRLLVQQGLARMRAGRMRPGIRALFEVSRRDPRRVTAYDLGFMLGPRLNAAGRLDDMSVGIECLLAEDAAAATALAVRLQDFNDERREIEAGMLDSALEMCSPGVSEQQHTLTVFDEGWHQGVVGILASRLRDRFHRPTIAFASAGRDELRGSGRSIAGLHLRDALDWVSKREPGLIQRFGGHAAAAGLTINKADLPRFCAAFEAVGQAWLEPAQLTQIVENDGKLRPNEINFETARALSQQVWGQGFAAPVFDGLFEIDEQRVVGGKHRRLKLRMAGYRFEAMAFGQEQPMPARVRLAYRLDINEYNGTQSLQLLVEYWEAA